MLLALAEPQVSSGYLIEIGNTEQDKFIFDLGTGAYINLWATGTPIPKLTKVSTTCSVMVRRWLLI